MDELAGPQPYPLGRRGFVMSSLISGLTLATTRVEAQAIHTPATGLVAGEVQIPVPDGHLPGYMARPEGNGPFPIVVVNEEIYGVHEWVKDICRRVAHWGYVAIAPEIYARLADLSKITSTETILRDVVSKKPDAELMSDLDAAVAFAAANHGNKAEVGAMGFCRGGRNTWLYAAHDAALKAAVVFYGEPGKGPGPASIQPKGMADVAADLHCPVLALYGAKDAIIPTSAIDSIVAKAKAAGKTVDLVMYPDAGHGFAADYRPSYKEADAKDALARTQAWFKKYLG